MSVPAATPPATAHAECGTPPTRTEQDSMGPMQVPAQALYGAQTQRAVLNFPVSGQRMPAAFIDAMLHIKAAAARTNVSLKLLEPAMGHAIEQACLQVLTDAHRMAHFPVDVYQTGSGTSTNMNVNEVVAHVAAGLLGQPVHPNDHVNLGQSSNDTIPSALHLSAALALARDLLPALDHLHRVTLAKAATLHDEVKTGRTHLMDAMPLRLSDELSGWAQQVHQAHGNLAHLLPQLQRLAQGGTAVGTGINAHPDFARRVAVELTALTGLHVEPAPNFFAAMGSQDVAVAVSGQLKTTAVALMKIANDLRWMNSGPLAGLGEIELEALQPGSSIMPGKVNPVIPEAVAMVAAQVIGHDAAITVAGQSGQFQLNVMLPLVAHDLLESIALLARAATLLADRAIATFRVRSERLKEALSRNPVLVTALNPLIGYERAAAIAKRAWAEGRPILDVADEMTDLGRARLAELLDPVALARGGL